MSKPESQRWKHEMQMFPCVILSASEGSGLPPSQARFLIAPLLRMIILAFRFHRVFSSRKLPCYKGIATRRHFLNFGFRAKRMLALLFWFLLALPDTGFSLPLKNPNVLLITIDCLRFDHMSLYGYGRNTTPHIDTFFKDAARFTQAISQSSWTSPSILSILTGLYPSVHGMDARGKYFDKKFYTPLKQLQEEGYVTLGYDTSQNYADPGWSAEIGETPLLETLKKHRGDKFFAWFHFKEPHLPYDPPEPFKSVFFKKPTLSEEKLKLITESIKVVKGTVKFDDGDKQAIRDLYDAEVLYQDSLLAPIFDFLADSGLLENTIVILTADHAEELLDHGFIGHASTSEAATVYDEVVRIPLLIKIPGNPVAEPVGNLVRQIDIMPTLFDVMGLKPRYLGQGRSLLPLIKKERQQNTLAFIETSYCGWQCPKDRLKERISAVRSDTWKFVEERKPTGTSYSFYDLVADKGETVNLYGAKETGEYQAILSAWQKENLQIARDRAMGAAEKHLLAAQRYGEQRNYRSAIQEIEQLLHLNEIYNIENPSFVEDPMLGETWKTTLQDAEKLLLRYREKERAP